MTFDPRQKRQDMADLQNNIDQHTDTMRAIMNNPKGIDANNAATLDQEQEDQYQVLASELEKDRAMLASVKTELDRWDTLKKAEEDVAALRVGNDGEGNKVYATVKKEPRYFASLGEQLQAIARTTTNQASDKEVGFLRQLNAAVTGTSEGIGADGGFLVQTQFANEIFRTMGEMGSILPLVRKTPVAGNQLVINGIDETSRATGSRWGGIRGYWVGEGIDVTASQMKFSRIELVLKKLAALGYATDELLADAAAMTTIFTQAFAEELLWLTENAIVNGSGAGEPLGILDSNGPRISVAKETGQAATTLVTENISKMWSRLHIQSRSNAVWLINQDVEPELDNLFLAAGTGGLEPRVITYNEAGAMRIKGRPVIATEYNATLGTTGDIVLADFSQYMMIDKNGIQHDSSMHVRFVQDEIAFRALYRVDGRPLWKSALTPANGSNTTSPFVTLATRS